VRSVTLLAFTAVSLARVLVQRKSVISIKYWTATPAVDFNRSNLERVRVQAPTVPQCKP